MWYVYVFKDRQGKIYIGSTNDLKRRLNEHKAGYCCSTKRFKEMSLEAYIAVNTESRAGFDRLA